MVLLELITESEGKGTSSIFDKDTHCFKLLKQSLVIATAKKLREKQSNNGNHHEPRHFSSEPNSAQVIENDLMDQRHSS